MAKASSTSKEDKVIENAAEADVNYKPTEQQIVDNRNTDYNQPNLNNPDSEAIHRTGLEDAEMGKYNELPEEGNAKSKDSKKKEFKGFKDHKEAASHIGEQAVVNGSHTPFTIWGVTQKAVLDKDGFEHSFANVALADKNWEHPHKGDPRYDVEVKEGEDQLKKGETKDLTTGQKKKTA